MKNLIVSEKALAARVGESIVILNVNSLKYFELTDVGRRIWELIEQGPVSESQICDDVLKEFEVDISFARSAVADFLSDAESKGLIVQQ